MRDNFIKPFDMLDPCACCDEDAPEKPNSEYIVKGEDGQLYFNLSHPYATYRKPLESFLAEPRVSGQRPLKYDEESGLFLNCDDNSPTTRLVATHDYTVTGFCYGACAILINNGEIVFIRADDDTGRVRSGTY